jgi:hypothetical protein
MFLLPSKENAMNMNTESKKKRTWTEEIEVAGNELVGRIKDLIEDSSATRVIIRKPSGEVLMEVPVVAGAAVGGAAVLFAPVLAAIGAMAALLGKFKVEIVREANDDDQSK